MAGRKQRDSFVLKHRLTGAAVLIGFAVVILPMLLGAPEEQAVSPEAATARSGSDTGSDTKVFRSNITPIGGATPSAPSADEEPERTVAELLEQAESQAAAGDDAGGAAEDTQAAAGDEGNVEPAEEAGDTGEETPQVAARSEDGEADGAAQVDEAESADTATTKKIERGWIVQVGTFENADNVEKLVAELESNGFGTSTTEVEVSGASATRVWVGPFATRVEAARMKTRVKQSTGSEGLIVAYP